MGVGSLCGGLTVSVMAVLFAVGGRLVDGTIRSDDAQLAGFAAIAGGLWGAIGGAIAGLVCAAVVRALSTRTCEGPGTDAAVAACVVAAIAIPFWLQSWESTSTDEAIRVVALPLLVVVVIAACGGRLVWAIRSRSSLSTATADNSRLSPNAE